ncbi:unnamed protein product [Prunus armeniaca]
MCIDSDAQLLECCHLVPPSFERVIVIYLEHPTIINVDESAMAWKERGPIARNLTAKFEHEDESDEQSGYEEDEDDDIVVDVAINMEDGGDDIAIDEAINIEDVGDDIAIDIEEEGDEGTVPEGINVDEEGDEGTVPEGINVDEEGDEGTVPEGVNVDEEGDEGTIPEGINVEDETINKEAENDKRAENENKESEEHGEDPEFYDSAYVQSEDEQCLLEKGDKTFDNYVDHKPPYIYPIADEGEKSDDMVVNDVNSFDSSSCDEESIEKLFSIQQRKIKFSNNDKDKVRRVCYGIKNGKCPWFVYASTVNGSSMVQIKSYEEEYTYGTVEHNLHTNS